MFKALLFVSLIIFMLLFIFTLISLNLRQLKRTKMIFTYTMLFFFLFLLSALGYIYEENIQLTDIVSSVQTFLALDNSQSEEELLDDDPDHEGSSTDGEYTYSVYVNRRLHNYFPDYHSALASAKEHDQAEVFFENEYKNLVWTNTSNLPETVILDIPVTLQLPELPRGCEVTSLGMMLNHAGVPVDKMALAEQIKRDPTPYERKDGITYFGHPNQGFIGDIYDKTNPGLGVYHQPIAELAEYYLPGKIIDVTGTDFDNLLQFVARGKPVWVIINTRYHKLADQAFETWQTPVGEVKITYHMHSAIITGFDKNYIYFNDPLVNQKNRKVPRQSFIAAWEQMGKQAISYVY